MDSVSTHQFDKLWLWSWNQTRHHGEMRLVKKLRHSRLRTNWLNPRLKNGLLLRLNNMNSSPIIFPFKLVDRGHTIYKLGFPHYMVTPSFRTSPSSMSATTVTLCTGSRYNIIWRQALPPGWQSYMCLEYKISLVGDVKGSFLQISSAVILCKRFGSAVYKNIFLLHAYVSAELLISTPFRNSHVNYNCYYDQHVEFNRYKIPLHGSAPNGPVVRELESLEDDYSESTTDKPAKRYNIIMDHGS